ncbi:MAG: serine O-acetyltransferase [Proteobacteria bacterium]|nr:serine O-acetyltransferase [Pseudomonadota bacterium]
MFLKELGKDIDTVFERDPAVRSRIDVVFSYPGFHALVFYRVANAAWRRKWYFLARYISNVGRFLTGIEIHPAVKIGHGFFIDHGMGVVIGETAEIGDNVTLYQGVTLGGISLEPGKRHPTLEDDVIVGAGAKILGPITIGSCARVGSNAVVVKDVPQRTTVVGIPARPVASRSTDQNVERPSFAAYGLSSEGLSDPTAKVIESLLDRVQQLSARLASLEEKGAESNRGYGSAWTKSNSDASDSNIEDEEITNNQ